MQQAIDLSELLASAVKRGRDAFLALSLFGLKDRSNTSAFVSGIESSLERQHKHFLRVEV